MIAKIIRRICKSAKIIEKIRPVLPQVKIEILASKSKAIPERANVEETHGRRTMFSAGISGYIFFIITKIIGREKIRHMLIIE